MQGQSGGFGDGTRAIDIAPLQIAVHFLELVPC
jgi:hypothetical protein